MDTFTTLDCFGTQPKDIPTSAAVEIDNEDIRQLVDADSRSPEYPGYCVVA